MSDRSSTRVHVSIPKEDVPEILKAIDAITNIPPAVPTNAQANLLYDLGVRIGSAALYGL